MVIISDLSAVLSGGATNTNPNLSLGGDPSNTLITNNVVNNLFDDISPSESEEGHEDYRCFYIFNDGVSPIFDAKIWILEETEDGASIEIGVEQRNEVQRITINGAITSGSFTLSYEGVPFVSTFNSDLGAWGLALQNSLRTLTDGSNFFFKDITISAGASGTTTVFDVNFLGQDGSRNHPEFVLVSNNLLPSPIEIIISTPQHGSPINTIAPQVSVETTPPGNVGFFFATEDTPIVVPKFLPDDGIPIWVKRVTPVGATPMANDGAIIRFSGAAFDL
jgi:hypothetical protein